MTSLRRYLLPAVATLILGVAMTMPEPLEQSLPGQIVQQVESPVVARIGRVTSVSEATNVTVAISGSDTLVNASYLFPQYQPLIGDLVYVVKQDAQWMVLGTMSGPLNTLILNPSFELGTVGALPTNWTFTPVLTTAGVMTFQKQFSLGIEGENAGVFRVSSAGTPGVSSGDAFSSQAEAAPGQRWASGYFIMFVAQDLNASLESQGGFIDIQTFIQFLDDAGVLISETASAYNPFFASMSNPLYVRTFGTNVGDNWVTAPPATASARLRIRVRMTMHVNSASELAIDGVLLRFA